MNCERCGAETRVRKTFPSYVMHEDKDIPVKRRKRQCVECKAIYYTIEMKSGTARWLAASAKETGLTRTPLASKKEQR